MARDSTRGRSAKQRILTAPAVVEYLLERGLLREDSVVGGRLSVLDRSRRNRNWAVETADRGGFFVKQAAEHSAFATLAHEWSTCTALRRLDPARLADRLPEPIHIDRRRGVVVFALLEGARPLLDGGRRRAGPSPRVLGDLGATLAWVHRVGAAPDRSGREIAGAPWPFDLSAPPLPFIQDSSPAARQIIRTVQRTPGFVSLLESARDDWTPACTIHGDLRWDNVVTFGAARSPRPRVVVTDWELTRFGDPAWDLGSVFAASLDAWVTSVPLGGDEPVERAVERATVPLDRFRPAMRAFWARYRRERTLTVGESDRLLDRSVRYAGVRLAQAAHEHVRFMNDMTTSAVGALQLAHNILCDPERVLPELLGVLPSTGRDS